MSSLPRNGLIALTWVFTGAAIGLTVGKYVIRLQHVSRLQVDDYLHGFSLIVMIGFMITYTVMFPLNYSVEFFVAGRGPQPSEADFSRYFHLEIAVSMLFWVIIYGIKFSFLFFYREIFGVSQIFLRVWWVVVVFTFGTFWACFLSVLWACGTPSQLFVVESCLSPPTLSTTAVIVKMWCVLNVISDLSIILLPLWMLRKLQVSTAQKIGLAAIFSLALADTVFDIVRTIYTVDGGAVALDTLWDILEPVIAVIASTLPTYRSLLSTRPKSKETGNYNSLTDSKFMRKTSSQVHSLKTLRTTGSVATHPKSASEENIFDVPREMV